LKILFLSTEPPYPPFNGVRIKTFHLIKGLHERGHKIHLISFNRSFANFDGITSELKKYCSSMQFFKLSACQSDLIKNAIYSINSSDVINFRFKSNGFRNAIIDAVKNTEVDLVHFDLISLTHYVKSISKLAPSVASINDSYSLWLKNKLLRLPDYSLESLIEKAYYSATFPLATLYEKSIYNNFQKVHVVSDIDRLYLNSLDNKLDVEVIPNGVDTEYFKPLGLPVSERCLVFVASMNGENASNAIWFIRKVFTRISKQLPNVRLYLVGRDPRPELLHVAQKIKGVIPTGYVHDIRPYIDRAAIVIDPTTKSCGILNHVLQSMAMGKTIVGTRSSFLAIKGALSWKHMVVARNEKDFVSSIVRLLKNESERKIIGTNARRLVETSYQWNDKISQYEKMYECAIAKFNR
jgi:glycosyltransferase involved in cell wall biosynthesis